MSERRVVVTGMGVISAIGKNVPEFWDSISECRSGIAPIELIDRSQIKCQNGAEVKNYAPTDYFAPKDLDLIERVSQFALIAAREAVTDSQIEWNNEEQREKTCISLGTSIGGQDTQDKLFTKLYLEKQTRLHPLTIPALMPNAGASLISMEFGITGGSFTVSTACASSNHAIGHAFWLIRNGVYDVALTGASETPFSYGYIKGWEGLRVFAPDTCRPFSKDRRGIIFGEGSGILVLENLESAKKRGAKIYGEICGFGMSADASHITKPLREGAERAMRFAMRDARMSPDEIDYVNAHGTGTLANDSTETAALRSVLGARANQIPVSSTKSMHGHALSASGTLEAIAGLKAIQDKVVPPTANFTEADPECDLDVVPNQARRKAINGVMSNAFAFGGLNAVLIFKRFE